MQIDIRRVTRLCLRYRTPYHAVLVIQSRS